MKIIVANWKMNMNLADLASWLDGFEKAIRKKKVIVGDKKIIVAPSFIHLPLVKLSNVELAAQNISETQRGAHTGEVGLFQVKDFCTYCIVGHSETGDSFETTLEKRDMCLAEKITPVVCFASPEHATEAEAKGAIICWEDPATISLNGTYRAKPVETIAAEIAKLRTQLAPNTPLLYGGSVNKQNSEKLGKMHELDGVLVGNASLDPQHFVEIVSLL